MIIPGKRKQSCDEESFEAFSHFVSQGNPSLAALPEIVEGCLQNLKHTSEQVIGMQRLNTLRVIRIWGNKAEHLKDPNSVLSVHENCLQILLQLRSSSETIVIKLWDCSIELTEIEFELLHFVIPTLSIDSNLLTLETLNALLSFLSNTPQTVKDLLNLHQLIKNLSVRFVEQKIIAMLKRKIKSEVSWNELLEIYFYFENHDMQNACLRSIASLLMKSKPENFPFLHTAEGYVNENNACQLVKKGTSLFYIILGFEGLINHDQGVVINSINHLKNQNHHSIGFSLLSARYYIKDNLLEEALEQLNAAVEFDPLDATIRKTRLYVAIELENYHIILSDSNFVLSIDSTLKVVLCYRALALYKFDRKQEAWEIIDSVIKDFTPVDCAYYIRARFHFIEDRLNLALADVKLLLKRNAANLKAMRLGAILYHSMNNFSESISLCTELLFKTPHDLTLRRIRGKSFFMEGKLQSALGDFNYLLQNLPDDVETLIDRAHVQRALDNHDMAWLDLQFVLELEPGNEEATELMSTLVIGDEESMIAPSA